MPILWTTTDNPYAPSFAKIDGQIVALVTLTAHDDDRWLAEVFPRGTDHPGYYCYAGNKARAKEFVENWLKYHAPDTTGWARRTRMPHEGGE